MSAADTIYTARIPYPDFIERARGQKIKLEIYRDGALAAPSSGTVTVYDASNTAIVDAQAVTISGSIAEYTISAGTVPDTLSLGPGWLIVWALVMPDSATHTFRRDAALVRRQLYPTVSDVDLTAAYSDLGDLCPSGDSSYQGKIDEAWRRILGRLDADGRLPHRIINPSSLRELHLEMTLELIFRDFAISVGDAGKYSEMAEMHNQLAEKAWQRLSTKIDHDEDGFQDDSGRRYGHPVIMLSTAPRSRWS